MAQKQQSPVTVEQLLATKTYVKPNGGMDYKSPADYINPFLDIVAPYAQDIVVSTSGEVINNNEDGSSNVAYARAVVQVIMPAQYTGLEHDTRIGLAYALDIAKPYLKVYTGKNAWACNNLSIFNADNIFTGELIGGWKMVYDKTKSYIKNLDPDMEDWMRKVHALMDTDYNVPEVHEKIGFMLVESLKNNFSTGITKAARELFNPKSIYAVKGGETTAWNVLSAVTQYITDSIDITDRPDRTLFAHEMFEKELQFLN